VALRSTLPVDAKAIHVLKITLAGSKPPIWRRLEVPSSVTLSTLHQCIQDAFEWMDSHLWAFETAQGDYGPAGNEFGARSASSQRLGDVAPSAGDRFRYVYDFGDDWRHDIVVEDVTERQPGNTYPRCTGGRRAGPMEDSGGIWGYAYLLEALADPVHEDHLDRLDWLGLDSPEEFDPAAFDLAAINARLGG
jgi:hypothetical protein